MMTAEKKALRYLLVSLLGMAVLSSLHPAPATAAESPWVFPAIQPLRVNLVQGLWHREYRLPAGLAEAGGAIVTESWCGGGAGSGWPGPGDQGKGWVGYFAGSPAELRQQHLVIVANVNAASFGKGQALLAEGVKAGGAVFFLGGRWAFGKDYADSPLAEICPVTFPGKGRWGGSDLEYSPEGVAVSPGSEPFENDISSLAWTENPRVFWYHTVIPKEGSRVILTAAGRPLLVLGTAGKGRVALFAGTVMGDPGEGQTALWNWKGWPSVLAATIRWLKEAPAAAPHDLSAGSKEELKKATEALETAGLDGENAGGAGSLAARLLEAALTAHTPESLDFLLTTTAALPGDIPPALVAALDCTLLLPGAGDAAVKSLLASGRPFKTALGLRALGASRGEDASAILARLLESGKPQPVESLEGLAEEDTNPVMELVDSTQEAAQVQAIRLGALTGLGALGTTEARAILEPAIKTLGKGRMDPAAFEDRLREEHYLYQQALMSTLSCGNETVAGDVVTTLMENIFVIARARTEENKPDDRLARVRGEIPQVLLWQTGLYRQLNRVPESVLPALATALSAQKDPRVSLVALAAFAGRTPSVEVRALLRTSPHEVLKRLGME